MADAYAREREVAIAAVTRAASLTRALQPAVHASGEALAKEDASPVTVADFGSQALVCERLAAAFPDDPVAGEENAAALREEANAGLLERVVAAVSEARGAAAAPDDVLTWIDRGGTRQDGLSRFWLLDPIDGTKGFLRGATYAVALALVDRGQVVVSALACPNLPLEPGGPPGVGVLFDAAAGQGARARPLTGGPPCSIAVSDRNDPTALRLCESFERGHTSRSTSGHTAAELGVTVEPVRIDSMAKYALVARGEAEVYLRLPRAGYVEKAWDHAAGALVLTEAGGVVSDATGAPLAWRGDAALVTDGGIVASNGPCHEQVLAALRRAREQE